MLELCEGMVVLTFGTDFVVSPLPDLLQDPSVLILIFGWFLSGCASPQELQLQPCKVKVTNYEASLPD